MAKVYIVDLDDMQGETDELLAVVVELSSDGVCIAAVGYKGYAPIVVENYKGQLRVDVWPDPENEEGATHTIIIDGGDKADEMPVQP